MGINVARAGYFYTIDSLELSKEQEDELNDYWGLIVRNCTQYGASQHDPLVSIDDMIQMSAVRVARAIKLGYAKSAKNKGGYYAKIVRMVCMSQIKMNEVRGNKHRNISTDALGDLDNMTNNSEFEQLHDRLQVDDVLEHVPEQHNRDILTHYYGLYDNAPIEPHLIGELVGMPAAKVRNHRYWTIKSLKRKASQGELSQWKANS